MAGGADNQNGDEIITAINVTPLVDIVLVLLIVLMVTSSYLVKQAINVELPKAATGEVTESTLSISIDADHNLYLDEERVNENTLKKEIRAARANEREVKAIISADGRVRHAKVVAVIDMLRQENVNKFAINTSPKDLEAEKKRERAE
ncbi:MAG: biopolymer transporter ExbD [Deltaproteobacteria bacterium]|nr:biopolymer transporter ExbD [Deltaproteobacteria bacterium]